MRKKQEYERKKNLEREKKKNRIAAHKKFCSRQIAKKYNHGMKDHVYKYLADVGFFTNKFKNQVLEQEVLPWLQSKVFEFVKELDDLNKFPDSFLQDHVNDFEHVHQ